MKKNWTKSKTSASRDTVEYVSVHLCVDRNSKGTCFISERGKMHTLPNTLPIFSVVAVVVVFFLAANAWSYILTLRTAREATNV